MLVFVRRCVRGEETESVECPVNGDKRDVLVMEMKKLAGSTKIRTNLW